LETNAFQAEATCVAKYKRPSPVKMLVELDPGLRLGEHLLEEVLASLQGVWTLVDAVELKQVKGIENHLIIAGATRSDLPNREIAQVKLRDHSYKAFAIVPMDHG
jgi:hypothetical protein